MKRDRSVAIVAKTKGNNKNVKQQTFDSYRFKSKMTSNIRKYIADLEKENRALKQRVQHLENTLGEIEALSNRAKQSEQSRGIRVEDIPTDEEPNDQPHRSVRLSNLAPQIPTPQETIHVNDDDDVDGGELPMDQIQLDANSNPRTTNGLNESGDVLNYLRLQRRISVKPRRSKNEDNLLTKCRDLRIPLDRLSLREISNSQKTVAKKRPKRAPATKKAIEKKLSKAR